MQQIVEFSARSDKFSRKAWLLEAMADEMFDQLIDKEDTAGLDEFIVGLGRVLEWCGSGNDSVLPDVVRSYLAEHYPEELQRQLVP